MTLVLHGHPLSSFHQKVVIALYENDTPFEMKFLDLGNMEHQVAFKTLWPIGKMPVLEDKARDHTVPETSIIIEYLARYYPGPVELLPADPDLARQVRFRDRFMDLYVAQPMQKIITDNIRPEGKNDPHGVEEARSLMKTALNMIDRDVKDKAWAFGAAFTMVDCAAAPALWYADFAMPFAKTHPNAHAYLERLKARPSFARVLKEAAPYHHMIPRPR
jgi:glutathione S-transferase